MSMFDLMASLHRPEDNSWCGKRCADCVNIVRIQKSGRSTYHCRANQSSRPADLGVKRIRIADSACWLWRERPRIEITTVRR